MAFRKMLPLSLLLVLLVVPTAEAKLRVGVGDQNAAMFDSSRWQSLKLKRTRYIVPWDWAKVDWQRAEVEYFMNRARAAKQQVLVTFSARRGCWNGARYSRSKACRAPSAKAYKDSFARFDNAFPWVKTYSPWNEVNHVSRSRPTASPAWPSATTRCCASSPASGAFKVMAADMLDTSNMAPYLRAFLRRAKGSPRLWGLHNYQDVNYRTSADTRLMLSLVPGEVWLTETGGIVKFGRLKYSPSRAAARTKWMFTLANRYDTRQRGLRSKITQLFVFRWFGEASRSARFDAGLVNADGTPRKPYSVFARYAKKYR